MDTVAHGAPAMPLADLPTTDEGAIDFRRLTVRLAEQCVRWRSTSSPGRRCGRSPRLSFGDDRRGLAPTIGTQSTEVVSRKLV